jgi:hypothetical protein
VSAVYEAYSSDSEPKTLASRHETSFQSAISKEHIEDKKVWIFIFFNFVLFVTSW